MHPELFELKALVAGRLDAHRRREIDDHLGSCADCSRHYVALMLGSASPKTAEAEARAGLIPSGAGTVLTLGGSPESGAAVYGIDAPIAPSEPRPAPRAPHSNTPALETEFPTSARTQVPVSASLVDAIAKLRAEADAPKAPPVASAPAAPEIVAPTVAQSSLIEPSIFMPTPADGISIVPSRATPAASAPSPELPGFMTRPTSASPSRSVAAQPELVVTFSSTPSRLTSYRSPSAVSAIPAASSFEYTSQAVPGLSAQPVSAPASDFSVTSTTVARKPKPMMLGAILGTSALVVVLGIAGYKYFQSSVAQASAAAAAAAAKQVQAAAAQTAASAPVVTAPTEPAPVQTRIIYVDRPARRG
ncbi:MAG: hypothetical protein U5K74_16130 [Gemmatimonadaceae bacterium]|nr:hypothetical protein [Gemmatimonadaceae bacterium]